MRRHSVSTPKIRRCRIIPIFGPCIDRPRAASQRLRETYCVNSMTEVPIIMPQLGESIAEATVINLLVKVGDEVEADQDLLEVETNKATMNVASPCSGRVQNFLIEINESYPVGAVLGYLKASKEDAARLGLGQPQGRPSGEENGPREESDRPRKHRAVSPTV